MPWNPFVKKGIDLSEFSKPFADSRYSLNRMEAECRVYCYLRTKYRDLQLHNFQTSEWGGQPEITAVGTVSDFNNKQHTFHVFIQKNGIVDMAKTRFD
jgi:hypothetical protein